MTDWLPDHEAHTDDSDSVPPTVQVVEPDPDPEALVHDPQLLPLEATAADVLDQRRDVPLDEEEEDNR